ncbi:MULTISPECIES: hypothetical protein [Natrinema]|uniref:Uncharacterized protein n=1 Tax=Natrinema gari JCM 14663 TaxID=1230459 RepID=L9Z0V2_9EURY|nr:MULTISPECIES: hypothetical protein [Natrinema]AFO58022.1 hypothetical protein NJ7G_2794 [Natrinema sp. J7-2]ELY79989.1 hypothetical protein C486_09755 [Natrinema gari JCM 14663]
MSVVFGLIVLALLVVPFVLWLAISRETSAPTVVDRAEAERIAKERGGREPTRTADGSVGATRSDADDDTAAEWGAHREPDARDGRPAGVDRDDRDEWGDRRT